MLYLQRLPTAIHCVCVIEIVLGQDNRAEMSKFGRRIKEPPSGYEIIEPTITALENELRESKYAYQ